VDDLPINITDAAIVAVLLISGVFAFFRGFVHELLAVVSWIGAGVANLYGFPYAQPTARELIASQIMADMAAGIGVFVAVLVVLSILTRVLSRRVRDSSLGPLDRTLGLVFGFARGAVLVCLAWLVLIWLLPREDHPRWITEARTLPLVERGGAALYAILPARLRATEGLNPTASGPSSAIERYDALVRPAAKGHAPADKPGYKTPERNAMQRLIEATTQSGSEADGTAQ